MENTTKTSPLAEDVESTVARLLAKENLTLRRSYKYKTAFFDVKDRVLGLPIFKEASKDMHDLFIGHEVGHALFTDFADFETALNRIGSKSLYNILEDIRIEKKIKREYPGLIRSFQNGYRDLVERKFFGEKDFNTLSFIDRLNVFAKTSDPSIVFDADEQELVDKALAIETLEDIYEVADLIKEKYQQDQDNPSNDQPQENSSGDSGESDDDYDTDTDVIPSDEEGESSGDSSDSDSSDDEEGEDGDEGDSSGSGDEDEEGDSDSSGSGKESDDSAESESKKSEGQSADDGDTSDNVSADDQSSQVDGDSDPFASETEEAFQKSLEENSDNSIDERQEGEALFPSEKNFRNSTIDYKDALEELRQAYFNQYRDRDDVKGVIDSRYNDFIQESRSFVNSLASEFLRKRSAFESHRSYVSQRGVIDVNSLHRYKYSDDIFSSVVNVPTAKSHGLVFLLDLSGSMNSCIEQIIEKLVILTLFCKKVNIPFEVYTFTTKVVFREQEVIDDYRTGEVFVNNLRMVKILSSDMKKTEYNELVKYLLSFRYFSYYTKSLAYGATPTLHALMSMEYIIPAFRKRNGLQVVNLMVLTDGEPNNGLNYKSDGAWSSTYSYNTWISTPSRKRICLNSRNQRSNCKLYVEHLRKALKIHVIGFYADSSPRYLHYRVPYQNRDAIKKTFRTDKLVALPDFDGYEKFILINTKPDTAPELEEGMTKAKMRSTLRKQGAGRKFQKSISNELMETICKNFA